MPFCLGKSMAEGRFQGLSGSFWDVAVEGKEVRHRAEFRPLSLGV